MLADLHLQHFRSYKDDSFEFSPGVNIIVGPNASGKTNLLESVMVVCKGSSYRAKDTDLVQFNQTWARLDSNLTNNSKRTVKIELKPILKKTHELDSKIYKRLNMLHTLPIVLFEPEHLRLLSGNPERRRNYLDDLLEQIRPGYGSIRRNYKRVLSQRNMLLKKPLNSIRDQIFPWNLRLSELAGQTVNARSELTNLLNNKFADLYKYLSQSTTEVRLDYQSSWLSSGYETKLLKKLEEDLAKDSERGFTGNGPHRDDLAVYFNNHLAQEYASRGEIRTSVLALKINELEIMESSRNHLPILLLDDVFSELDGKRRYALTNYLTNHQTFITTTDADLVLDHFTESCNVIPIN
jgi:DNA replication and repair protein RecF